MRIFTTAFAGGFVGKLLATLFIAICTMLGVGPEKWATCFVAGVGDWATPGRARIVFIILGIITFIFAFGPSLVRRFKPHLSDRLSYLSARDYDLGLAIIEMAHRSAWGRWFAAQNLAIRGAPIKEGYLLNAAARAVRAKILDGELAVHGRLSGQTGCDVIQRTDWRDATIHFFPDPEALWKMLIIPAGGTVTFNGDGNVHIEGGQETIAHLLRFDSFLVDSHQFEKLWPRVDPIIDKIKAKISQGRAEAAS